MPTNGGLGTEPRARAAARLDMAPIRVNPICMAKAAALGLLPGLLWTLFHWAQQGFRPELSVMTVLSSLLPGAAWGIIILWLLPLGLFTLLSRAGVKHVRVVLFKGISHAALLVAASPLVALVIFLILLHQGACEAAGSCSTLRLVGTWGFALSIPAGGLVLMLGLIILGMLPGHHEDRTRTVGEAAREEGLLAEKHPSRMQWRPR